MRRLVWILPLALVVPALAEDPPAEGGEEGGLFGGEGLDLSSVDIDMGPELLTYEGSHTQTSQKLTPGATLTISTSGGDLSVRCSETDQLTARLDFAVQGTDKDITQRYGDSLRLSAWGGGVSGGAKVTSGARPSNVKKVDTKVSVTVPHDAKINATAYSGWVEAIGCDNTVTISASTGGAFASGHLKGFNITAANGDVRVRLEDEAGFVSTSSVNAPKGAVKIRFPHTEGAKLDARGTMVDVSVPITGGTVTPTSATGTIGSGKPSLTVRAGGEVRIGPMVE